MKASLVLSVAGLAAAAPQPRTGVPEYYLIRHAEKTGDGSLSARGLQRAQCLVNVFGKDSKYNIQHIMVQTPHPGSSSEDHRTQRPYNTTLPLAESLGIKIDTPCEYKDYKCAAHHALNDYSGPGNVLIAWEHSNLPLVADAMGAQNAPWVPYNAFDHIYNLPAPYNAVTITSEDCPGLDN